MNTIAVQRQRGTRFSRRRALILRAAAQAFGRKGFHATTLEEIAAALNLTKASLYYYFSTKEELLFEVHLLSLQDLMHRIRAILAEQRSPVAQMRAVVAEHLRLLASDYEGAFLLQQEYELPASYRAEIVKLRDSYEHKVLAIVREGIRAGSFRVRDPRIAVHMILGAVNWFLRWYRSEGRLEVDEIIDAYMDFFFHGLLAPGASIGSAHEKEEEDGNHSRRMGKRGKGQPEKGQSRRRRP